MMIAYAGDAVFARNLARLLRERGETQVELARGAGMSEPAISNYTCGKRYPTLYALRAIRSELGCTWDELLGE